MESDDEIERPPPRPKKNFNVFTSNEDVAYFPRQMFEGAMGQLPLLISVNVGYDPDDPDPFMYHYESQEVLFAFKKGAQTRVLFLDSLNRTLSLPLASPMIFCVGSDDKGMTMAEILAKHTLPVTVRFARLECMDFMVDRRKLDNTSFGNLTVFRRYEEPFWWCLSITASGDVKEVPVVLPRNLKDVCFSPVVAIMGAADPAGKVKECIQTYTEIAQKIDHNKDPFFSELAFVSRGPEPVDQIDPYIDEKTFTVVRYKRRPAPLPPQSEAPSLPPRSPHQRSFSSEGSTEESSSPAYSSLLNSYEEPVYEVVGGLDDRKSKTLPVNPVPQPLPDKKASAEGKQNPTYAPALPPRESPATGSRGKSRTLTMDVSPAVLLRGNKLGPLSSMTVENVADKLKELGLDKYVKKFRKNRIDGVLLQKLTENVLKAEFKMTHVEFLLLNTFITEGHIPKTTKSP